MSRQWIIGGLAVAALAVLVGWVASNTYWKETTIPALPRGEAARNPFYTAQRLSEELGATAEWRRALGELPDPDTVLVLVNWHWDLIDMRRARLEQWVESGGRLVLVGDLMGGEDGLQRWSGLAKEYPGSEPDEADEADPEDRVETLVDSANCTTLWFGSGWSRTSSMRERYRVCGLSGGRLVTARDPEWSLVRPVGEGEEPGNVDEWLEAARVAIGSGTLTWFNAIPYGYLQPFANHNLLAEDHALLLVELLQLQPGDHVVFMSEERGASLVELIWTYGAPAVVLALLLVALALWRNAARFGPLAAVPDPARRSLAEQIRGTARFSLAAGGGRELHAAMTRALHEAARMRIVSYERMSVRDRIAAIARLTGAVPDDLASSIHAIPEHNSQEFRRTIALLDDLRCRLLAGAAETRRARGRRAAARTAAMRGEPIHL